MQSKIKLKKTQLNYFRRLARESPNEIQAYLIGSVISPHLMVVDKFMYTKQYWESTPNLVAWYRDDYEAVKRQAEELGLRVIGFIHSHPEWDAVMSPTDFEACVTEMHRVCGIVSTDKGKSRVRFWTMDSPLPCEIVYAKRKQGNTSASTDSSNF